MTDWREVESRVHMTTGKRLPVVIVRGEGSRLYDEDGKAYLDFFAATAVTSPGQPDLVLELTPEAYRAPFPNPRQ